MKKTILIILLLLNNNWIFSQTLKSNLIILNNNTVCTKSDELISVPWLEFLKHFKINDTSFFKIVNCTTKKEIPIQLESLGTGFIQNVLMVVSVPAKSELCLTVIPQKRTIYSSKTYARFVPERKDDFAWENNVIAYRAYGKALESTNENAYGIDVWAKRTDSLIINKWYKNADYHKDHGEGLDYYSVGFTLGAGGVAPYQHDSIWYSPNFISYKVLDNGPLRTSFDLMYPTYLVDGKKITIKKRISIDLGSQLFRNQFFFESELGFDSTFAIGITRRKEPGVVMMNEQNGVLGYWEPADKINGTTGVGIILSDMNNRMSVNNKHYLIRIKPTSNSFIYYSGASWNKAGKILNEEDWFNYLNQYKYKLVNPIQVSFK
jgi:hypothetical protein